MNSISMANTKVNNTATDTIIDRTAKKFVLSLFTHLTKGHLRIEDHGEVYLFGQPESEAHTIARIHVNHSSAYKDIFMNSTIGAGEAYMKGNWSSPDLLSVIQMMVQNLNTLHKLNRQRPLLSRLAVNLFHRFNANSVTGSKKNISAHYDLGNEFFSLFLDDTMMYSSAIFPKEETTLHEASLHKLDTICKKLELKPEDHLLEIGTGWGGLAIHAAQNYKCRVTTTTISKEQYDFAKDKIRQLGLEDKVTLLLKDYRELEGQYDKLVSIEMIEAVGHQYYNSYFSQCDQLLKDDGLMLIQAITISDQRYKQAKNSVDFIQRYIFPGGCLPSNEVVAQFVSRKTDMQIIDLHDITLDYAITLKKWREAFHNNIAAVKDQGFSDTFCRMWEYYLCYCEGGFRERSIGTVQYILAKPEYRSNTNGNHLRAISSQ